jgi:hypothetical protein
MDEREAATASRSLHTWVSAAVAKAVRQAAAEEGLSQAAVIRRAILRDMRRAENSGEAAAFGETTRDDDMSGKQSHNRGHEYGGQQIRERRGVAPNRPGDLDALRNLTDDERHPALREALGFGAEPGPAVAPEPERSPYSDFDMRDYNHQRDAEERDSGRKVHPPAGSKPIPYKDVPVV